MPAPKRPSERTVILLTGYLTALATRGAPPFPSVRQLAIAAADALDLGVRTVQRGLTDPTLSELVAHAVAHADTPGVSPAASPQVAALPAHPDDTTDTSLLLGALRFSPSADPRYYSRLEPNQHAAFCTANGCRAWVEPGAGSIALPYPRGSRVIVLCADHALVRAVDLAFANVKL